MSQQMSPADGGEEPPAAFLLGMRLGDELVAEAVEAYRADASSRQVAGVFGISKSGLLQLLRLRGVEIRQRHTLTDQEIVVGVRLYESGALLREIAERYDVSTEQVRKALLRAGVKMRPGRGGRPRRQL